MVTLCYRSLIVEYFTIIGVLNLNTIIYYYMTQKMFLCKIYQLANITARDMFFNIGIKSFILPLILDKILIQIDIKKF